MSRSGGIEQQLDLRFIESSGPTFTAYGSMEEYVLSSIIFITAHFHSEYMNMSINDHMKEKCCMLNFMSFDCSASVHCMNIEKERSITEYMHCITDAIWCSTVRPQLILRIPS